MPVPNQLAKLTFSDMDPVFQQHYSQMIDTVNSLAGHNGVVSLADHLDLGGKRIMNVAAPSSPTDALSSAVAEQSYSATALRPKLQPGGSMSMPGYRQIGSGSQREPSSSFLNDLMSSVPSANAIYPTITNAGSTVNVSIPASLFTFADGTSTMLIARTDTLSVPGQYAISSIVASAGNIAVTTSAPTSIAAGQVISISGVTPATFNGTFTVVLVSSSTVFQVQNVVGSGSGTGGNVQLNGVYYYSVKKRSQRIGLFGPFSGDTAINRMQVNYDSYQIVATVVITNSGGQVAQSGGGGSPIIGSPSAGAFF